MKAPAAFTSPFDAVLHQLRPIALSVGVISFFINLLILPISLYSLQVMDRVMSTGSLATLGWLTVIMIVMFVAAGILQALRSMILLQSAEWLHDEISAVALPQVLAQAASGGKGALPMRDAASLKQFLSGAGLTTLMDAPWSILYIGALFLIHSALGTLVVAGVIALLLTAWLNEVAMRKPIGEAGMRQARGLQELELATRNGEVTEAMGMSDALSQRWKAMQKTATELQSLASNRSAIIQGFTKFIRLSLQILITGLAAWLAIEGKVTAGAIIAAAILGSRALAPFEVAISGWKSFTDARGSYGRLKALFAKAQREETMQLPPPAGYLSIEQLTFAVPNVERPILKNIQFAIEPGETLGVIGPSGSGKSTLARLVLGVWPITSGAVRLDGADVYRWPRADLGRYVGYLPQDVELFGGSIKDNIARFQPDATPEAIVQAAHMASAHEIILRLPQGYDTDIGSGGSLLSAGQRQRIGLARAFYGEPRVLVLDEPDANLDDLGQQALIMALSLAKRMQMTTIIITHRKSLLAHVDKLLLLRDGQMEAFGPAAAVMSALNARQHVPAREGQGAA